MLNKVWVVRGSWFLAENLFLDSVLLNTESSKPPYETASKKIPLDDNAQKGGEDAADE
jgi:hypothetical protein